MESCFLCCWMGSPRSSRRGKQQVVMLEIVLTPWRCAHRHHHPRNCCFWTAGFAKCETAFGRLSARRWRSGSRLRFWTSGPAILRTVVAFGRQGSRNAKQSSILDVGFAKRETVVDSVLVGGHPQVWWLERVDFCSTNVVLRGGRLVLQWMKSFFVTHEAALRCPACPHVLTLWGLRWHNALCGREFFGRE